MGGPVGGFRPGPQPGDGLHQQPVSRSQPTPPRAPTAQEIEDSRALVETLDTVCPLEPVSQVVRRDRVLAELQALIVDWVRHVAILEGINELVTADPLACARLCISGSYVGLVFAGGIGVWFPPPAPLDGGGLLVLPGTGSA